MTVCALSGSGIGGSGGARTLVRGGRVIYRSVVDGWARGAGWVVSMGNGHISIGMNHGEEGMHGEGGRCLLGVVSRRLWRPR